MIHSRQIEKVAEARIANCQLPIGGHGEELIMRTIMMMTTTATMILMTIISIMMIHSLNNNKRSPASYFLGTLSFPFCITYLSITLVGPRGLGSIFRYR